MRADKVRGIIAETCAEIVNESGELGARVWRCSDWTVKSPIGRNLGKYYRYAVQLLIRYLRHGTIGSDLSLQRQTDQRNAQQ